MKRWWQFCFVFALALSSGLLPFSRPCVAQAAAVRGAERHRIESGGSAALLQQAASRGGSSAGSAASNSQSSLSEASRLLVDALSNKKTSLSGSDAGREDKLGALMLAQNLGVRQDELEALVAEEATAVQAQQRALQAVIMAQTRQEQQAQQGDGAAIGAFGRNSSTGSVKSFDVSCWSVVRPCGHLTWASEGTHNLTVRMPFGNFMILGNQTQADIERVDEQFANIVVWSLVTLSIIYFLYSFLRPGGLDFVRQELADLRDGDLDMFYGEVDEEQLKEEMKDRMDPNTTNFIAPGNVYRLLAIMHPGVVGWTGWRNLAFQALICAFMQVYMPYTFMYSVVRQWDLVGIKSPLWYAADPSRICMMTCLVGALSLVLGGKIRQSMVIGAEANFYILTHHKPGEGLDDENIELKDPTAEHVSMSPTASAREVNTKGVVSASFINRNEIVWCWISSILNIMVALLCQIIFIVEVSVCGLHAVQKIVSISIALYFLFEIDDRIMDIDPHNRTRYRREVLLSTVDTPGAEETHKYIKTVAGVGVWISWGANIFGMVSYVFLRWRNAESGYELGAAPL